MQKKVVWSLLFLGLTGIILAFYLLPLFLPLLLGLILAYLLEPVIDSLEQRAVPRRIGIIVVFAFIAVIIILAGLYLIPALSEQILELSQVLPLRFLELKERLLSLSVKLSGGKGKKLSEAFLQEISLRAEEFAISVGAYVVASVPKVLQSLFIFFVSLVLTYYFLSDRKKILESLYRVFPLPLRRQVKGILKEINASLGGYLRGLLIVGFLVGLLGFLAMIILGVRYALLIGIIVGFTNLIPYFGPVIGAIPGVILAFLSSPSKGLWAILAFTIVQQIDNVILTPKIVGDHTGLHPITVIMAVLAGERLWGFGGMLVAVPLVAIIKSTLQAIYIRLVRASLID